MVLSGSSPSETKSPFFRKGQKKKGEKEKATCNYDVEVRRTKNERPTIPIRSSASAESMTHGCAWRDFTSRSLPLRFLRILLLAYVCSMYCVVQTGLRTTRIPPTPH